MSKSSGTTAFRLYNEKADKLEGMSFTKRILSEGSGVQISVKRGEPVSAARFGPDQESIEAFVLTFRFFVQDNEPSSFRNLAVLYDDPTLSLDPDTVHRFKEAREAINSFLDAPTMVRINERRLTRREVFEVFMWGALAHSHKKDTFDKWAGIPVFFQMMENEFVYTLASILRAVFAIRELNKEALRQLEAAPKA